MSKQNPELAPEDEAHCIACGCPDSAACEGGCSWLWVDRVTGRGLCSMCEVDGI